MSTLNRIPFFQELNDSKRVLIAGAGGGFDVYCGLPLYFTLQALDIQVQLANLSFTWLGKTTAETVFPYCRRVVASDRLLSEFNYFPEKYLAEWFLTQEQQISIYAFETTGVKNLKRAYDYLIKEHEIDTVILVDGGTDSLMFGDEEGLGTPEEDSCSLAAVYQSSVRKQFLVCLGFGVDHFHGVSHYHFLENVAELSKEGGFLGCFSLTGTMDEFVKYRDALSYANRRMPERPSIVSNSIISAVEGHYGDHHRIERTEGSTLWINPLMSLYWCFRLAPVVKRMKYFHLIRNSQTMHEISNQIASYRRGLENVRERRPIPI